MTSNEKRKAAENLLQLIRFHKMFLSEAHLNKEVPTHIQKMRNEFTEKKYEIMIDLYAEHFSEEQLQSQIVFYESAEGQALTDVKMTIRDNFVSRIRDLIEKTNLESSSGPLTAVFHKDNKFNGTI